MLDTLRDALDSRLLSSGRETVDQLSRNILKAASPADAHAIVDSVSFFALHLPHKYDSLTTGVARLIFNLISSAIFVEDDLNRLISVHVSMLNLINDPKLISSSSSLLAQLLRHMPVLLNSYSLCIFSVDLSSNFVALTAAIHYEPFLDKYRLKVIEAYCDHIVGGKQKAPPTVYKNGFIPLYSTLNSDEMDKLVVPVVDRMLKRAQGSTIQIIVPLFENLKLFPIDSYIPLLKSVIGLNLRSPEERRRKAASQLFRTLTLKARNSDLLQSLISEIADHLSGKKDGFIANIEERLNVINALGSVTHSPIIHDVGANVVALLQEHSKRETHDEGRIAVLELLSQFVPLLPLPIPNVLVSYIEQTIIKTGTSKPDTIVGHLIVLLSIIRKSKDSVSSNMLSAVEKILNENFNKSQLRTASLACLAILCQLGNDEVVSKFLLTAEASFATSFKSIIQGSARESFLLGTIINSLFANRIGAVWSANGSYRNVFDAIIALLVRPENAVNISAFHLIRDFPQLAPDIIQSFYRLLFTRIYPESATKPTPFQLLAILRYVATIQSLDTDSFLTAALICHHPALRRSAREKINSSPWDHFYRKQSKNVALLFAKSIDTIVELVFSGTCLLGSDQDCFLAGSNFIATVIDTSPSCYEPVFNQLKKHLDCSALSALSETDLAIFSVPDGQIAKVSSSSTSPVNVTPRVGRSKQMSDEEWAAKVQSEIDSKKGLMKKDEELVEVKRQNEIRARISSLLLPIQCSLEAIRFLCLRLQKSFTETILSSQYCFLLDAICQLAPFSLITAQVRQTLASIANTGLEGRISSQHGDLIAYAVAVSSQFGSKTFQHDSPVLKTVSDAVHALVQGSVESRLFSGSTIRFLMPLFEAAAACLSLSTSMQCISVLTAHSTVSDLPVDRVLDLSLEILKVPRGAPDANTLLHGVSPYLKPIHIDALIDDRGLLSSSPFSRKVALETLALSSLLHSPNSPELVAKLFLMTHDDDAEQNLKSDAERIWHQFGFKYIPIIHILTPLLSHPTPWVRRTAAISFGYAIRRQDDADLQIASLLNLIKNNPDEMVQSQFDIDAREIDRSATRVSAFIALGYAAPALSQDSIMNSVQFILETGFLDKKPAVWNAALQAGLSIISTDLDASSVRDLQLLLDKGLSLGIDSVSEGAIVLIGRLAQFLDPKTDSEQVKAVFSRLIDALRIPSYSVQCAVAECLVPLAGMLQDDEQKQEAFNRLIETVSGGKTYGDRKGAALGLAGLVKGLRISSLKKYGVLSALTTMAKDKRSHTKQGALFCYEALFSALGKRFEPYLPHLIPDLLASFGDPVSEVREATQEATRVVMAHVTAQGVKMMLPHILKALDDDQWRTKVESIGMLGSMAFCAPRQLCAFLPTVVPRLTRCLADPHPKVQEGGKKALAEIGSVIRNPEIQSLVPSLLAALIDPSSSTRDALQQLLDTSFVNSVDAPSLALIIPIVKRGLHDRSPSVKRMAALIVGTICEFLRDVSAILPYTKSLLDDLQKVLIDPIPDVRASSARAMGLLFKGVGEVHFPNLIDWLLQMLYTNTSSVERNGGAQGLAQVLAARGLSALSDYLDVILEGAGHNESNVREAYMEIWVYLPRAFGGPLHIYLERALPVIINGLADDKEAVRSMSLSAGKSLITAYGADHFVIFLPFLQESLRHEVWRVREHTCVLIGDVLARICGAQVSIVASDHIEFDMDDQRKVENEEAVLSALGRSSRDRLFSDLFIVQADSASNVQQTSWLVWKSLVANTNRMLADIMPVLMENVIKSLSDPDFERRTAASKSLGSMVQRSGEIVLPIIIPILEGGLSSPSAAIRQGVCFGMSEVMASASKDSITAYMSALIPAIRSALCDESEMVRVAAARSFETLVRNTGPRAVADIVPPLVKELSEDFAVNSLLILQGLRQVLQVRSSPVLNHLIPAVISRPITPFYAKALASLSDVYGPAIDMHIDTVMPWYLDGIANTQDPNTYEILADAATSFLLGLHKDATHSVVQSLCSSLDERRRNASTSLMLISTKLLGSFCSSSQSDYSSELESILGSLLSLLISAEDDLQNAAAESLLQVTTTSNKDELVCHLVYVRQSIQRLARDCARKSKAEQIVIPGLCQPSGIAAILPIYQYGLLNGSPEQRQQAATALGDLITYTTPFALKPYVIKITGPLIRIVGDRFPSSVKAAILTTLGLLLDKAGPFMKPFVPQLQATFTKSLRDPDSSVRSSAAPALASLLVLAPKKVDPLVQEIVSAYFEDNGPVSYTMVSALCALLSTVGSEISPELYGSVQDALVSALSKDSDSCRSTAATGLGHLSGIVSDPECRQLFERVSSPSVSSDWEARHGLALACAAIIRRAGAKLDGKSCLMAVQSSLRDTDSTVRQAGLIMGAAFSVVSQGETVDLALSSMIDLSRDRNADVRMEFSNQINFLGKSHPNVLLTRTDVLNQVVNVLLALINDGSQSVSLASQNALGHTLQLHRGRTHTFDSYLKTVDVNTSAALDKFARRSRLFRSAA